MRSLSQTPETLRRPAPVPVGVMLVNLGSPDEPSPSAVRRYLDEFLSDPLVVDIPRPLWWLIRKGIVLPLRGPQSAALYRSIWTPEGSPLIAHTRRQRELLARELGGGFRVVFGMRYGSPSIADAMGELAAQGCRSVVLVPMFPQYSRSTTGSVELAAAPAAGRAGLELTIVPPYFEDEGYVSSVAARLAEVGPEQVDHVVLSFHGLPQRYVERGDPYREHCQATAGAVARALDLARGDWSLAFQSRFGPGRWLKPDVAELVPELARAHPVIAVTCPGFPADCLETLEEIGMRLRERFARAGGRELRVAACLNDHPTWIHALANLVRHPG